MNRTLFWGFCSLKTIEQKGMTLINQQNSYRKNSFKMTSLEIVKAYYEAFNQQNWEGMLALVSPEICHQPNQGEPRIGIELFKEFLGQMDYAYEEKLTDMVFFTPESGNRIAAEFVVNGIYKVGDEGFPEAHGQTYVLPAAAFLEVTDGKISRVTTYYNLPLWIKLVS